MADVIKAWSFMWRGGADEERQGLATLDSCLGGSGFLVAYVSLKSYLLSNETNAAVLRLPNIRRPRYMPLEAGREGQSATAATQRADATL